MSGYMARGKKSHRKFVLKMNKMNKQFIKFEIRWLRKFIWYVDAHRPIKRASQNVRS